jgi:fatty acid desaturase
MPPILKIGALAIGLTALAVLVFFGFAIWVFIPLLPAGIIFLIAVQTLKERGKPANRPSLGNGRAQGRLTIQYLAASSAITEIRRSGSNGLGM